jgi:MFS family permease
MAHTAGEDSATIEPPRSAFVSAPARSDFWLFCAATFLAFLSTSTLSFASVIFASVGMTEEQIGLVLSSPLIPISLAILVSGYIIDRFSALRVAVVGQLISLVAFLSFQFTIADPLAAASSRILLGLGFGIFWPAAMVYAKGKLQGPQMAYLFGIYSMMVNSPNVLGPGMAEWYFDKFGVRDLFFVLGIPLVIGSLLMATLRGQGSAVPAADRQGLGYWALLKKPSLRLPNFTILMVGIVWGFGSSFMALVLHRRGLVAGYFFASCTAALIASRFVLLALISAKPREIVVGAGMLLMAVGCLVIALLAYTNLGVAFGGFVFGLGYSMTFPVVSVWISSQFGPEARGKPVALFGMLFHFGIFALPIVGGFLSGHLPLDGLLLALAGVALLLSGMLWVAYRNRLRPADRRALALSSNG